MKLLNITVISLKPKKSSKTFTVSWAKNVIFIRYIYTIKICNVIMSKLAACFKHFGFNGLLRNELNRKRLKHENTLDVTNIYLNWKKRLLSNWVARCNVSYENVKSRLSTWITSSVCNQPQWYVVNVSEHTFAFPFFSVVPVAALTRVGTDVVHAPRFRRTFVLTRRTLVYVWKDKSIDRIIILRSNI